MLKRTFAKNTFSPKKIMPPIQSGFAFLPRQQYHLCAVPSHLVFSHMTENQLQKPEFQKLDEMREKDAKLFEAAFDLLFSVGYDNLTEEMVSEVLEEAKEGFENDEKSSVDDLFVLVAKMLVLCAALELRTFSLPVLLDYVAEKGWRE